MVFICQYLHVIKYNFLKDKLFIATLHLNANSSKQFWPVQVEANSVKKEHTVSAWSLLWQRQYVSNGTYKDMPYLGQTIMWAA